MVLNQHAGEDRDAIASTSFDVCWNCPEQADLGTAVVTVNFKLRSTNSADDRWQTLIYTLKESPIRYYTMGRCQCFTIVIF